MNLNAVVTTLGGDTGEVQHKSQHGGIDEGIAKHGRDALSTPAWPDAMYTPSE